MTQTPDTQPGAYFVSIRRDGRTGLLAGPFINDHAAALAMVDAARIKAEQCDPRAVFDSFGTVRLPLETAARGRLNEMLGLDVPQPAPAYQDISHVTEYGLTQRLSSPVRVF